MTKQELIEKLQQYPDNYDILVDCDPGLCDVVDADADWNNNRIILYTY